MELSQNLKNAILEYKLHLEMQLGKSPNTVASYVGDVEQFAQFLMSKKIGDFAGANQEEISEWIARISGMAKTTTQSRKLSAIKSFGGFLIEEKIWRADFSELIARPRVRREIPRVLSREEVLRLLAEPSRETLQERRDRAMLELMYCSGLRVSELCAVKISDFDFDARIIRVCGKGDKVRLVPIGGRAVGAINSYVDFAREFFRKKHPVYLFITNRGGKLSRKTFWFNIKKYAQRAGIEQEVKPHMLRHSFATHLLGAGANLMAIKEMLGHSDLSTTQIYTKVADSTLVAEHAAKHPRNKMRIPFGK
ncbi:MAG: tyrosine recombinase [Opitutales bacterium]|nr:tyrosine recombinase [Opitutales bacterium]